MVLIFVGVAVGVGIYCRKDDQERGRLRAGRPQRGAVDDGVRVRHVSYFSAVVFVGYAGQFGWKYGIARHVGRHRQRHHRQPSGLVGAGSAHARDDAAPWTRTTMPEFFGKRYGQQGRCASRRQPSSSCSSCPTPPASTTACRACSAWPSACPMRPASSAWRWSPASTWCIGGYMATVMNDLLQGIVMLLGIVAVIVAVLGEQRRLRRGHQMSCRSIPLRKSSACEGAFV